MVVVVMIMMVNVKNVAEFYNFFSSGTWRTSRCTMWELKQSIDWAAPTTQKSSTSTSKRPVSAILPRSQQTVKKFRANEVIFPPAAVTDFASPRFLQTETKKKKKELISAAKESSSGAALLLLLALCSVLLFANPGAWISQNLSNIRTLCARIVPIYVSCGDAK